LSFHQVRKISQHLQAISKVELLNRYSMVFGVFIQKTPTMDGEGHSIALFLVVQKVNAWYKLLL